MTYPNAKVVNLAKKFVTVKLDVGVSAAEKVAIQYKVEGTPTLMFLDSSGKKVHEVSGFYPPDDFIKEMKTALGKMKKT